MFGREKMALGALAVSFLAGAVAGAAVALLLTPMTGKKMQRKVGNVADKVVDAIEDHVETAQSVLRKIAKA